MAEDEFDIHVEKGGSPPADINRLVQNAMADILQFAEGAAKAGAPRRTGNLGRNIGRSSVHKVGNLYSGATGAGRVGVAKTAPYAKWVESGTGIFGVFHHPIIPTTGNYLRWRSYIPTLAPRHRPWFFAKSVKGQRPQRFMFKAYEATRTFYVPARIQLLKAEIAASIKASGNNP